MYTCCSINNLNLMIDLAFFISCKYDTNKFLYSKKYWCPVESRLTCEILADSHNPARSKTDRVYIMDLRQRGLFVKVTGLQLKDTGLELIRYMLISWLKLKLSSLKVRINLFNWMSCYTYCLQCKLGGKKRDASRVFTALPWIKLARQESNIISGYEACRQQLCH